jgi:hypothetical protein
MAANTLRVIKKDPYTGKVYVAELKDVAPYWLFDTKTVAKDSTTTTFFDQRRASGIETNMLQPNTLPSDWTFNINAIRVVPDFSADPNEIASLVFNSVLKFNKEGSEIFKAPTFVFNSGAGVNGSPTNGYPSTQAVLMLPLSLQLKGNQPFSFELVKDATLSNDIEVKIVLDGIVYKNIVSA